MWLDNLGVEAIKHVIRSSSSLYLISKTDGHILWANPAFCEWSGYTLSELIKLSWMQISVNDDDLRADLESIQALEAGSISEYTVQKRYIPKNGRPQIGSLHVLRYPVDGAIEFCWCRWEPLNNGTAQAFELAIDTQRNLHKAMTSLIQEVRVLSDQTEEERFSLSAIRMAKKHPKIAAGIVIGILALAGFDSILSIGQKLGIVPQPVLQQPSSPGN